MLIGQILDSQATLNNYRTLSTLDFVPGEQFRLVVKFINSQLGIRYVVDNPAATAKFIFNTSNNGTVEVPATFMTDDRSIVYADIEESVSEQILGGNFTMEIDVAGDASEIKKVFVQQGLTKQLLGAC